MTRTFERSNSNHQPAIVVRGLAKRYREVEAVRGVDFEVATGEVFGFLGPVQATGTQRRTASSA